MKVSISKIVSYYRVSTQRQAGSGLGLEAQQAAVQRYAASQGAQIVAHFTEVETGKSSTRPQLAAAIRLAKANGATLVVAKLDRLARNVAFTAALMESGVDFIACDNPHANRLTLHILAAVAEDEARRISDRTKAALAAAKARGVKLGAASPRSPFRNGMKPNTRAASARSAELRAERVRENYASILPTMRAMRESGETFAAIAVWLNKQGYRTTRGHEFGRSTVMRVLARCERQAGAA
ncbi:MAG TPA: recombinase family protein [Pirellulales bacterium]|nr:recombinase family protein [Pirellulales bacterium]